MLDTVALTLNSHDFMITAPDKFCPSANIITNSQKIKGRIACTQHIKDKSTYYPRLTISRIPANHGNVVSLRVEASLPKLMYGNNFDELTDNDLPEIVRILHIRLKAMGVLVEESALRRANISAIHFSKNILLSDYATCSMIIAELQKANISKRLDINRTIFINGGIAVKYHANSYEIAIYDKWADLQQARISPKRGIERDYDTQHTFIQQIKKSKPCEVLRLEIRFVKRTSLRAALKLIGWQGDMTLEKLFGEPLSQKILLQYWRQIIAAWDVLAIADNHPEDIFRAIINAAPELKPLKAFQLTGALLVARSVGVRGLRLMLDNASDRTWQNLRKQLETLELPTGNKLFCIMQVMRGLEIFTPLRSSECINYPSDINDKIQHRRSNFVDGQSQHGSLDISNIAKRTT